MSVSYTCIFFSFFVLISPISCDTNKAQSTIQTYSYTLKKNLHTHGVAMFQCSRTSVLQNLLTSCCSQKHLVSIVCIDFWQFLNSCIHGMFESFMLHHPTNNLSCSKFNHMLTSSLTVTNVLVLSKVAINMDHNTSKLMISILFIINQYLYY